MTGSWDHLSAAEIDLTLRRHAALNQGDPNALTPDEMAAYLLEVMSVRQDIAQRLTDPEIDDETRTNLTALDTLLRRRIPGENQ